LCQRAVVDRVVKIISAGCRGKIDAAAHVDDKLLTLLTLEVEHAVMAERGDTGQFDAIAAALDGLLPGVYDCVSRHITS
jgi:hypothetical protein